MAAKPDPKEQPDQRAMRLFQPKKLVTDLPVAREDIDPSRRDVRVHKDPIKPPEQISRDAACDRVFASLPPADHHVCLIVGKGSEKIHEQFGRLLQIGGDDSEIRTPTRLQSCSYRGMGAEIPRMQHKLRREWSIG